MDKNDNNDCYVTADLCDAYRKVLEERIKGLKHTVYVSALSITTTLAVVQIILTFLR